MQDLLIKCDIDGVLRNWEKSLVTEYKKQYPHDTTVISPFKEWAVDSNFPNSPVDIHTFFRETHADQIYYNAELLPGASRFIKRIINFYPHVWLVSKQYPLTMDPTVRWCQDKLPFGYNLPIVFTSDKRRVGEDLFRRIVLIDDAPENIENEFPLVSEAKNYFDGNTLHIPICFGQRYNEHITYSPVQRIADQNYDYEKQFEMLFDYLAEHVKP